MEGKVVNLFNPGKILSVREVDGCYVAEVDFGAPVAVILDPYQDEQVGDYILMNREGGFNKIFKDGPAKRLMKRKERQA